MVWFHFVLLFVYFYSRQRTTKPTIRLARPANSDQPAQPRSLIWVFTDRMCLLQHLGYPKKGKREPLPCWMDVQADLSLCWLHRSYYRFCRALAHFILYKVSAKAIHLLKFFVFASVVLYVAFVLSLTITKTHLFKYIEKFTFKNWKFSDKKFWYFSSFCSKQWLWVFVRTCLSRNKKNNVYPCKPQFYCIKVGFKGVTII